MNVVVHEHPGKDLGSGGFCDLANSRKKMITVLVVPKNIGPLDPVNHHMVKRSGGVQSRLSWHNDILSRSKLAVNLFVTILNYVPFLRPPFFYVPFLLHGMKILGPLLDLKNPNKFVWLRSFPSLDERDKMRNAFYEGELWKNELEAIAMPMLESYDVILCETSPGYVFDGPREES
jgi:hypothetical protein